MSEEAGSPRARPKRCSSGKQKKLELLERLKAGKKNKYDIGELENVYEEVDEREYTKKVLERQEDDWIVDDGGCGYVEDGREIFDDDLDEESIQKSKQVVTGRKRMRDLGPEVAKKGNIRNLLVSMPSKKKKKESGVKLEDDDILGDIIGELDSSNISSRSTSSPAASKKEMSSKDYLKSLSAVRPTMRKHERVTNTSYTSAAASSRPFLELQNKSSRTALENEVKEEVSSEKPVIKIKEEPMESIEQINEDLHEFSADIFDEDMDIIEIKDEQGSPEKLDLVSPEKHISSNIQQAKEAIGKEWDKQIDTDSPITFVNVDKSKLPLVTNENGQEVLRFYYWDANEELYTQPGTVFLFGKVWIETPGAFVSCCIAVKNIDRRIFLLPREKKFNLKTGMSSEDPVSMTDVYEEFNSNISDKYKIKQFKSRKISKKYAFGDDTIPLESEYLEVRYSASFPALPSDLKGETFSNVFGTRTSFLEILVLERGIKGPCWIEISNAEPVQAPFTWCKVEASCLRANDVTVLKPGPAEIPPLVMVALHLQAVYIPKYQQTEIVAVSCLVNNSFSVDKPPPERLFNQHFCVFSRPSDVSWPFDLKEALHNFKKTNLEKMESERALLNLLLTKLYRIDPDIVVGYDLCGYGIDLIVKRLAHHKVPNWSRLGRLKRATIPTSKFKNQIERIAMTGRLLCDIKVSAKELIRARSFDLESLCQNVLHFKEGKRLDLTDEEFKCSYNSGGGLVDSLWWLMSDSSYILRIFTELNVLPLALQITNIAGNVLSRTLLGGRSERNEFLLLHAFHNKGYIVPDKDFKKNTTKDGGDFDPTAEMTTVKSSKKKPSYAGGLVLDPKVGFYDDLILLMDFNSLYPSIIQEYNICFTTISASSISMDDDFMDNYSKYLPEENTQPGILPIEIRKLVESRRGVKDLLKNSGLSPELKMQYDIRQMALKLTANSMYGCLGFINSRFCAKGLAAIVTAKGREILLTTKRMVEGYGYDVVYGDTDSIMINTKTKEYEQVKQIGQKIKIEVNKCYRQVELDIDGVFKYMLLLKKKKYAAVTLSKVNGELLEKQEIKGLDIVRRDWSQLAAEAGKFILKLILSNQSNDDRIEGIHRYLEKIRADLEGARVPLSLLTVTKQLTKPPQEYNDVKALPHVQVALRLNKTSARRLKQGDTVSYVICQDGTSNSATQRAYHIEEMKTRKELAIDVQYYLEQQIHPVVARLCDPIEGTDAASLATCLGLDAAKFARHVSVTEEATDMTECIFGKRGEERFKDCERFKFVCKTCDQENIVESLRRKIAGSSGGPLSLERCSNPACKAVPIIDYFHVVMNKFILQSRSHIAKFYEGWLVCDDPVCRHRTKEINPVFEKGHPVCTKCEQGLLRREISCLHLYNQQSYFQYIVDLKKESKVKIEEEIKEAYKKLYHHITFILSQNKYSTIDLGALFSQLCPSKR